MLQKLWSIQYRPSSIDDYIFPSEHIKQRVNSIIESRSLPHLLLHGSPGTGKTTLALLLVKLLEVHEMDFLRINGSNENSVDVVRNKIEQFISLVPHSENSYKIIYIDECDYLTHNAQAILRVILEEKQDRVRFILSCNFPHKIMDAIKSRCEVMEFKSLDKEQIFLRAFNILQENGIQCGDFELDSVQQILDNTYPDVRKFLDVLRTNIDLQNKCFVKNTVEKEDKSLENKLFILESLSSHANDWNKLRERVSGQISDDEFLEYYRFLYDYIHETEKFSNVELWKAAIVVLADGMYKHSLVADQEINFIATLIKLNGLK